MPLRQNELELGKLAKKRQRTTEALSETLEMFHDDKACEEDDQRSLESPCPAVGRCPKQSGRFATASTRNGRWKKKDKKRTAILEWVWDKRGAGQTLVGRLSPRRTFQIGLPTPFTVQVPSFLTVFPRSLAIFASSMTIFVRQFLRQLRPGSTRI